MYIEILFGGLQDELTMGKIWGKYRYYMADANWIWEIIAFVCASIGIENRGGFQWKQINNVQLRY